MSVDLHGQPAFLSDAAKAVSLGIWKRLDTAMPLRPGIHHDYPIFDAHAYKPAIEHQARDFCHRIVFPIDCNPMPL